MSQEEYLAWVGEELMFTQALWKGFYNGLYSVHKSGMVPKPGSECMGEWIVDDLNQLNQFKTDLITDYWNVDISEYEKAWHGLGSLMFKNFDDCHFKAVFEDVSAYCQTQVEDETSGEMTSACSVGLVFKHLQSNVFGIVTQASALAATFE